MAPARPGRNCPRCPRLVALRQAWRAREPGWFNAPVPAFGPREARLAIIGLAPGLRGANRTGRPFTGDFAGGLLYHTLSEYGFARGRYDARADDGLELIDCRIVNAVRCVPPENKPTSAEIANCRPFLNQDLADMPNLAAIVALGRIAHDSIIVALGGRVAATPFGHARVHGIGAVTIFDSYHCSRQNTNTGRLTPDMFRAVFAAVRGKLDDGPQRQLS